MSFWKSGVLVSALVMMSACATAEERAAKPVSKTTTVVLKETKDSVASAPATDDGSAMVCKKRTRTGSRLGSTKVCRTKAEWDRIAKNDSEGLRNLQNNQVRSVD